MLDIKHPNENKKIRLMHMITLREKTTIKSRYKTSNAFNKIMILTFFLKNFYKYKQFIYNLQ